MWLTIKICCYMKLSTLIPATLAIVLVSCSSDKDNDVIITCDFEGAYFDLLIDSPQYNGPLLYNNAYEWHDPTTDLYSQLNFNYGTYAYYNGGIAISDYCNPNPSETDATYEKQLEVCNSSARSGKNFAVVTGYNSMYGDSRASMEFRNGSGVVDHMYVCITSYLYYVARNGYRMADPLAPGQKIYAVATGYDLNDCQTGSTSMVLIEGNGDACTSWKKWSLAGLGEVHRIILEVRADDQTELLYPAYFAIDDIAVRE